MLDAQDLDTPSLIAALSDQVATYLPHGGESIQGAVVCDWERLTPQAEDSRRTVADSAEVLLLRGASQTVTGPDGDVTVLGVPEVNKERDRIVLRAPNGETITYAVTQILHEESSVYEILVAR